MNFSQNLMFSSHFNSMRCQRTWMTSQGFPLNKCCPKSSENNDYHTLYFQHSGSNLTTSTGIELDDIIYLYSSPFYLCCVSFWGGNVLRAVTKQIWSLMCLIVWLWVSWWVWEHHRNHIQLCYRSRWTLELRVTRLNLLYRLISLKCWDASLTSCFASVWYSVKNNYKGFDVSSSRALKLRWAAIEPRRERGNELEVVKEAISIMFELHPQHLQEARP